MKFTINRYSQLKEEEILHEEDRGCGNNILKTSLFIQKYDTNQISPIISGKISDISTIMNSTRQTNEEDKN